MGPAKSRAELPSIARPPNGTCRKWGSRPSILAPTSAGAVRTRQMCLFAAELSIDAPNVAWGIDITYIRLRRSWMYLVAVMDLFSRFVLAWQMDDTLEMAFVMEAVNTAFRSPRPRCGIVIKDRISPARCTSTDSPALAFRSAWMAKVVRPTTFSLSACGEKPEI